MHCTAVLAAFGLYNLAVGQKLTKPTLESSLDYLQEGLMNNLKSVPSTNQQWNGWIPTDCQQMARDANLDPNDVTTFNVTYDDCDTPWLLCRHKASPDPVGNMINLFGRVPVHMRQWVRHMIALPDPTGGHAYNSNGNIAMFNLIEGDLTVFIHETGHSLDGLGAYADKPLSSSDNWLKNYALDNSTCDPYGQSSQLENVAQTTVIATYNENVPGGYCKIEKHCDGNFHQYATLQTEADATAPGNILHPGGKCTHRLTNSPPVRLSQNTSINSSANSSTNSSTKSSTNYSTNSTIFRKRADDRPDVSLPSSIKVIEPVEFNTKEDCKHTW